MNGVIIVDKPENFTSFDVVAVMRKLTYQKKIGHAGTLDPNATGVLPLFLGSGTKAISFIENHDKEYIAGFKLGMVTDTLDIWGSVLKCEQSYITQTAIENELPRFTGNIAQIPPMFSAAKKNGKRLYSLARQGIEVEREAKTVTIFSLALLNFDETAQEGTMKVLCSKGTYIRTLIDDLGAVLKCGACLTSLVRTKACGYHISEAVSLSEIQQLSRQGKLNEILYPVESIFNNYPSLKLSKKQSIKFKSGAAQEDSSIVLNNTVEPSACVVKIYDQNNVFIGLGEYKNCFLKALKLFLSKEE